MFGLDCNDDPNEFLPPGKAYQTNPLLNRSRVGRATNHATMNLPADRVFGKVEKKIIDGAKQALSEWSTITPKLQQSKGKDFISSNKDAVKNKMVSAAEVAKFRSEHPCQVQAVKKRTSLPHEKQKEMIDRPAGLQSHHDRSTTPISSVISCIYQHEWETKQRANMACWKKKKAKLVIRSTQASRGHATAR